MSIKIAFFIVICLVIIICIHLFYEYKSRNKREVELENIKDKNHKKLKIYMVFPNLQKNNESTNFSNLQCLSNLSLQNASEHINFKNNILMENAINQKNLEKDLQIKEPVKIATIKISAIKAVPIGNKIVRHEPIKNESYRFEAIKNDTLKFEPFKNKSIKNENFKNEFVKTDTLKFEPFKNQSIKNEKFQFETIKTDTLKFEPLKNQPTSDKNKDEFFRSKPNKTKQLFYNYDQINNFSKRLPKMNFDQVNDPIFSNNSSSSYDNIMDKNYFNDNVVYFDKMDNFENSSFNRNIF